jgi:hypothetical protein
MNDIRQMFRAAPGLVITVGSMLAVAALLGIAALLTT